MLLNANVDTRWSLTLGNTQKSPFARLVSYNLAHGATNVYDGEVVTCADIQCDI